MPGPGAVHRDRLHTGYWRADTGWASSEQHYKDNLEATWRETAQDAGTLAGIRNEDGWLIDPRSEDPYANLSWGWWWDNATDSAGQIWEGHSAWSQRESDPEYHETYTAINTVTLLGGPFRLGAEILDLGGGGTRGGSGTETGTGSENPTGSGPYDGPGPGPGAGGGGREIGDVIEDARTPITERLDDALEQTPALPPLTPDRPDEQPPSGPSEPGTRPGQDPADQEPAPPPTPPPGGTSGQGGESGGRSDPRGDDQAPRGDNDGQQPRPRDGDRQGREGTTPPPVTGGGSNTTGDGTGSSPQGRDGSGGLEDTTRPRGEEKTPERPPGRQDEQDQSQQEHQGSRQRERQDEEPSPTPEAETGGGGGRDGGGGPPPTSGGDESGRGGSDDEGREDGSDDSNNIDPYSITPSDHLPRGNLRAGESDGYDGRGHTIARHVDVDDDYLRNRTLDRDRPSDIPPSGRFAGRYHDLETAERATATAPALHRTSINEWLKNDMSSLRNQSFTLSQVDVSMDSVGHALRRQDSGNNPTDWETLDPNKIRATLRYDEAMNPQPFRVHTSSPEPSLA
ncbi:RNase A-like domain-containing protein [Nocardiopsis xinjiangensis]|uniref:RNase A-like domain-containing protein n=1 Tax=Nocardiopsis xinjiangensis TaxID=124285 RepID=UPI00034D3292|nr:RNase A-like domain-containing protein [Nocardiopsis xinjiangensis]